jgi:hypothetical protein
MGEREKGVEWENGINGEGGCWGVSVLIVRLSFDTGKGKREKGVEWENGINGRKKGLFFFPFQNPSFEGFLSFNYILSYNRTASFRPLPARNLGTLVAAI